MRMQRNKFVAQQFDCLFGRKSTFTLLLCNVQFNQHILHLVYFSGTFLHLVKQSLIGHTMYQRSVWHHHLHFVSLQVTNEMPFDIRWQRLNFSHKLLWTTLRKHSFSRSIRLFDCLYRMKFRHTRQFHPLRYPFTYLV